MNPAARASPFFAHGAGSSVSGGLYGLAAGAQSAVSGGNAANVTADQGWSAGALHTP